MTRTVTDPPPVPTQHARPGVEISAAPVAPGDLNGLTRLATVCNSLWALHTGTIAIDSLDPTNNALTSSSRDYTLRPHPPWFGSLPTASVDVWLYVVRGQASPGVTWEVTATSTTDTTGAVEVNGGTTTGGAWWKIGSIDVDDSLTELQITVEKTSFNGNVALNSIEGIALLPTRLTELPAGEYDRDLLGVDVALADGEQGVTTLLLQMMAGLIQDVADRGGQAYCCSDDLLRGDANIVESGVVLLDDVPEGVTEAEFVFETSGSLGASPLIRIGSAADITPGAIGIHRETVPVNFGVDNYFVISTRDISVRNTSVYYKRVP